MSFYIRKSLKAGPLRFNLSKSGIGVSAGVTGFRIGKGPRGNYVHIGRGGAYYRKTFPSSTTPPEPSRNGIEELHPVEQRGVELEEIESVDVLELHDSSSADLLEEINSKHKVLEVFPFAALLFVVIFFILMILGLPSWAIITIFILGGIALFLLHRRDQLAKTVILFYDLDPEAESAFQAFHDAYKELLGCSKSWHVSAAGEVKTLSERKRQAGASSLVKREANRLEVKTPPNMSTNVFTPAIPVGRQTLYFFPDRILVYERNKVGAVSYPEILLELGSTKFIETESVPRDARVIGHTWQYVNKSGGPDRRYKDNRKIPIALYSEVHFKSRSGLNELIQLSKAEVGVSFSETLKKLSAL
jgi:hypothetical protein